MIKTHFPFPADGQIRAVIENVSPELDGGKYPVKSIVNQTVVVSGDVLIDGHDLLGVRLLYKHELDKDWQEKSAKHVGNDRWKAAFTVEKQGFYSYYLEAWVDHPATWQHEVDEKIKDGQKLAVELMVGEQFLSEMAGLAKGEDKKELQKAAKLLVDPSRYEEATFFCRSEQLHNWIEKYPIRKNTCRYPKRRIFADRAKAEFSAWYSMFPRSAATEYGKHGTFKDVINLLPRISELGFDVLYLPPVHPIGHTFRKGKNNSVDCQEGEPGVPYGIGSELGGHTDIHPDLGTLDDFKLLIQESAKAGIEIAMDLAIQCSPDHPWVKSHPDWFRILPDGTIKYAENPPKKYQDIYPVNFETADWKNLWNELKNVIYTWAGWGVRIIRVDNPHTKSFGFWEWVIAETKKDFPDMIFLSEAFTKPKVMQQLAKVGFTQSYTYYTWRTSKAELIEYMTELTKTDMKDYFRPNFWPNTHDINPYQLQSGNEPQFLIRYFMAATLSSNYGIFGPTYEYLYHAANPPKEEYSDSEKYEIKWWNWAHRNKLTYIITQVNRVRKENTALRTTNNIQFCEIGNDQLLAYLKTSPDGNRLLFIVNLDQDNIQGGILKVPLPGIYKSETESYQVHDLITGAKYVWKGQDNYVELDPNILPFHLFRIEDLH
ncbi:DUF3416 domain-containing protein [Emticicia sp. CRIBPO]|uniref:alpha-1,4-glucan--maltose-1-phosphate maltosyltransferase n=1 Tax=Emticicia sp. CRIBPO TaxID=2683258 RepID=UPI001412240A|nr:alpha-1,4-glucan--maltose-1-phosphate maltosyltransferase [Emticicia sp. CRIBPO]NBA88016.1 DUF3416 domain-containing protein [Emticicia sp. CRIBPO]